MDDERPLFFMREGLFVILHARISGWGYSMWKKIFGGGNSDSARTEKAPEGMNPLYDRINWQRLPRHVAVIMDGNGRWAQGKGLIRTAGHKAGVKTLKNVLKAAIDLREVLTKLTEENAELRRLAKKAEAAQARTAEELQAFREKTSLDRYLLQSYLADELEAHRTAKQVRKQRRRAALENAFRRRVESKLEILTNIAQALEKTRAALDDGIDEPGEQELAKHREELDALIAAVRQREAQVRTRSIQRYETALRVLRANPSAKAKAELGEAFDSLRKLLEK